MKIYNKSGTKQQLFRKNKLEKNMKTIFIILYILLTAGFVFGEKVAEFPELINPSSFTHPLNIDGKNIFITDGINVYIYSAEDYKLKKKIGKAGEGPGEFIGFDNGKAVTASISPEHVIVSSVNKVSFFSKKGDFIKEVKTLNGFIFITYADNFVGNTFETDGKNTFSALNFYDNKFTKVKELARFSQFSLRSKFSPYFIHRPKPVVYKGKLYVNNPDTGIIDVYEKEGNKIKSLSYNYENIKVTDSNKKETFDFYEADIRVKQFFKQVKNLIDFPEYFPLIKTYHIADNKIYVLTYKQSGDSSEFLVFDLNGKFLKKLMFPLEHVNYLETTPYTIHNGKIYQLLFDDDSEMWNLYTNKI